jgi:hypothetical protein
LVHCFIQRIEYVAEESAVDVHLGGAEHHKGDAGQLGAYIFGGFAAFLRGDLRGVNPRQPDPFLLFDLEAAIHIEDQSIPIDNVQHYRLEYVCGTGGSGELLRLFPLLPLPVSVTLNGPQ